MRRTTMRRRAAAAVTVPILTLGLVACGGEDSESAEDASSDESSQTSDSPSTDESSESSDEPSGSAIPGASGEEVAEGDEVDPDAFLDDLQGAMDSAESAKMTMNMTGPAALTMNAVVDYSTNPPQMQATMKPPQGAGKIDMRLVDEVMYMNMGQLTQNKFIKLDLNDPNSPLGDTTALKESMDPVSSFESFAKGLESVTYVGEEEVAGGDQAGHYELTIDTTKIDAMSAVPGGAAQAPQLPKELTYDLWLDDENRMRKADIDMGQQLGQMTMDITDWNEPVKIIAPKPNQITKAPGT